MLLSSPLSKVDTTLKHIYNSWKNSFSTIEEFSLIHKKLPSNILNANLLYYCNFLTLFCSVFRIFQNYNRIF